MMAKLSEKHLDEIAMSHQIEVIFCPYVLLNTFALPDVMSSVRSF